MYIAWFVKISQKFSKVMVFFCKKSTCLNSDIGFERPDCIESTSKKGWTKYPICGEGFKHEAIKIPKRGGSQST